jgi:hypothetical protein
VGQPAKNGGDLNLKKPGMVQPLLRGRSHKALLPSLLFFQINFKDRFVPDCFIPTVSYLKDVLKIHTTATNNNF